MIIFKTGEFEIKYNEDMYTVICPNGHHRKFKRWEKVLPFIDRYKERHNVSR